MTTIPAPNNSNPVNLRVIAEFRSNAGHVGGEFAGLPLLLLTTTGARTGLSRTTPLAYVRDGARLVVFASNGAAPVDPAWFRNLMHRPEAIVEVGTERFRVRAVLVEEHQHDELWRQQIAQAPVSADFRAGAGRVIPLVALERLD